MSASAKEPDVDRKLTSADKSHSAVLIAEDDEHMRVLLTGMVRDLGFPRAVEAASIRAALDKLGLCEISLALVDLGLGEEDGLALITALRVHPDRRIREMPIVVVSRTATEARILEAMKAGADGYIAKPFNTLTFHRQVSLAVVKRALSHAPEPRAPQGAILDTIRDAGRDLSLVDID
jgi:two-component system, chemotaxis family, chemotaxis protein CheY